MRKRLLTDLGFVDFGDYFGRFLIRSWGVIYEKRYCPPTSDRKLGSKEPHNRLNPNPLTAFKRPFLLLELVVALTLAALLLSVVFRFFISHSRFSLKLEQAQQELRSRQRVTERLDTVFCTCHGSAATGFYTTDPSPTEPGALVVQFDAGVDPDPFFSGLNIAKIFLHPDGDLCLMQRSMQEEKYRTEVLLDEVRGLEWEFLGHQQENDRDTRRIVGTWAWLPRWPKHWHSAPSVIRLHLWRGIDKKKGRGPNLQIAFILPHQEVIQIFKN